ncbi:carbonic anhydrase/acetyltransferase [Isachenkonia alkalipeptolytica]|uniref:Carbonic anhydrase/acetyltransferase n=1 Tax=Isachenkonia alkalipeptolytica TaxID=2565777 RepID=A0AA43XIF9_9CLOT|nr:carbonic anhydrase/acetyltransferase [Isachenkonia alkalipeptolytica]NBG86929.1 carbonic anhydrase/acetyltransferase [Isachenkonia alkalipeptolytica]
MTINTANSAGLKGSMELGTRVYIAQGTVIRGGEEPGSLSLGNHTWALENSVLVGSKEMPTTVGSKTVFGHKCVVLNSTIGHLCEVGNGTIFMPGSKVGNYCIFGEGTLVPEGMEIPEKSVVVGRPARVLRKLTGEDEKRIKQMRGGDITLSPFEGTRIEEKLKEEGDMGKTYEIQGKQPVIGKNSYLAPGAEINGDVIIGDNTVIADGVRIIGNSHGPVRIGNHVQILENCVLHLLPDNQLIIEDRVVVGPGSIIHGTTLKEGTIVESGSNVCDYSELGSNCLVKAGTLIKQRSKFEDDSIIEGFPGKTVGKLQIKQPHPPWAYPKEARK